jgi:hypothetical protein
MQITSRGPGVLDAPGQQVRVAGAVVADRAGSGRGTGRVSDLGVVGVAVGIDADDAVDEFCQHGHWPIVLSNGARSTSAPAWMRITGVAYL